VVAWTRASVSLCINQKFLVHWKGQCCRVKVDVMDRKRGSSLLKFTLTLIHNSTTLSLFIYFHSPDDVLLRSKQVR
jgi:hypothetical protein